MSPIIALKSERQARNACPAKANRRRKAAPLAGTCCRKNNSMELIDSHAHIDFPQFAEDREAMLERARAAGVSTLLAIGTGPARKNWTLHFRMPSARLDLHHRRDSSPRGKRSHGSTSGYAGPLAKHPRVIAWGEIGLDYHYDFSPRDVQQVFFGEQMALAQKQNSDYYSLSGCLVRLPGDVWKKIGSPRTWRNFALFHEHA